MPWDETYVLVMYSVYINELFEGTELIHFPSWIIIVFVENYDCSRNNSFLELLKNNLRRRINIAVHVEQRDFPVRIFFAEGWQRPVKPAYNKLDIIENRWK